jgi:hypothetical protein
LVDQRNGILGSDNYLRGGGGTGGYNGGGQGQEGWGEDLCFLSSVGRHACVFPGEENDSGVVGREKTQERESWGRWPWGGGPT